jgi:hypothetical protein
MHLEVHDREPSTAGAGHGEIRGRSGQLQNPDPALKNGHTLRARVPEEHSVPENQAWLTFPPERTKLFADERLVR